MSTRHQNRRDRSRGRTAGLVVLGCAIVTLGLAIVLPLVPDHEGIARARHGSGHAPPAARPASPPRRHARPPAPLPTAVVTIGPRARIVRVPRSFFGLSTEYWSLPLYERHLPLFEQALSLLRVRGGGPQILRIGGDSADHAFWDPRPKRMPWWVFKLTPAWVNRTAALVRQGKVRLILDLNLITGSSRVAALWARAAEARLPRGSIIGFEVGNEPDLYAHWFWLASIGRSKLAANVLPRALSAAVYSRDFSSYARMLGRIAPGVPLAGPALANPQRDARWLARLIHRPHDGLGIVSAHRYPFSACVSRSARAYPTIARLLSDRASAGLARSVRNAVWLAHRAGLKFRLTEMNSVTCGGLRGVSDTFATALWAPDTLFELLRAGVDGVNVHLRANTINAPFALTPAGFVARPLMYGLLLFTRMLGQDARLVDVHTRAAPSLRLKAWAVQIKPRVLRLLLIDKGRRSASVLLRVPGRGPAVVQRLLAPSVTARSGVTLAGQQLDRAGLWAGRRVPQTVSRMPGGYVLTVPRASAAMVTVRMLSSASPGSTAPRAASPSRG